MKKLFPIFVMLMFLMSMVPLAFAEEVDDSPPRFGVVTTEKPTAAPVATAAKEPRVAAVKEKAEEAKEVMQTARERYEQAKGNLVRANEAAKERAENLKEAKERLKDCEENNDCAQAEEQIRGRARESLHNAIERMIAHLEKVKAKAEDSNLDESSIADIEEDIDGAVSDLEEMDSQIDDADSDGLKRIAKELRNRWARYNRWAQIHAARIYWGRFLYVMQKSDQLGERLENALARLEGDTSDIQDLIDSFNSDMESAKGKIEEAKGYLDQAHDLRQNDGDKNEVNSLIRQAKQSLSEAKRYVNGFSNQLRNIVSEIKGFGGDIPDDDSVDSADDNSDGE